MDGTRFTVRLRITNTLWAIRLGGAMKLPSQRVLVALAVGLLALSAGSMVAAAGDETHPDNEVRIVDEEIVISDATFHIKDTTFTGPGLEHRHIEDRTYTLEESTVTIIGLHIDFNGTRYTICNVTLTIEDIGVHLQDVTIS